jgi:hypothetical protein
LHFLHCGDCEPCHASRYRKVLGVLPPEKDNHGSVAREHRRLNAQRSNRNAGIQCGFRSHCRVANELSMRRVRMKQRYALIFLIGTFSTWSACAEEQRRFRLPPKAAPLSPVEAASQCQAYCLRPCSRWAQGQSDFQFSYDACTAKCLNLSPCTEMGSSRVHQ